MTTHAEVEHSELVQQFSAGSGPAGWRYWRPPGTQSRYHGGSLANNDPAACYPAAARWPGASIQTNKRLIAADDYFTGMFETALAEDEIITEIRFAKTRRASYEKFSNPASRYAMVGCMCSSNL